MRTKDTEILKTIVENLETPLSIRQISRKTKMDYKNVYLIIQRLVKENIIEIEKISNINRCILTKTPHPLIYKTEYERRNTLFKNKNMKVIWNKLNNLNFQLITLLFGSQVKGTSKNHSDIDILIISEKSRETEIEKKLNLLPLPIHLTIITYEDLLEMLNSKKFTIVSEAIKKNIILTGVEDYYRLLSHVEQ